MDNNYLTYSKINKILDKILCKKQDKLFMNQLFYV